MKQSLSDLENQLCSEPGNKNLYELIISELRSQENEQLRGKLQEYRNAYSDAFPVSRKFVIAWVEDCALSRAAEWKSMFETIARIYPDFEVVSMLLEKVTDALDREDMTPDEARPLFEQALGICGNDVFTGSDVWRRYREFEVDEYEDVLELQASAEAVQKSKERFIKVYLRQLALPLVGNEETLKEFEAKLAEFCVEKDFALVKPAELESKFTAAKETREARLIYEMHLLEDKYGSSDAQQKEAFWQGYIAFEKKQNQLSRAQRLFERAVLECPDSVNLWLDFVNFALTTVKNWSLLANVTRRALLLPSLRPVLFLWKLRMVSVEGASGSAEEVQAVVQGALGAGLGNVEEYLEVYLSLVDFHRRRLQVLYDRCADSMGVVSAEAAEKLRGGVAGCREALQTVQVFLQGYGAGWTAGWWRLCKYQSQLESALLSSAENLAQGDAAAVAVDPLAVPASFGGAKSQAGKAKSSPKTPPGAEVWEAALKVFPASYFMWSEYVQWARQAGAWEHCRKLYRRMVGLTLDVSAAEVCQEWVRFEAQHGTLADLQAALVRAYPAEQSAILAKLSASATTSVGVSDSSAVTVSASSGAASAAASSTVEGKRKRPVEESTPGNDSASKKVKFSTEPEEAAPQGNASAPPVAAPVVKAVPEPVRSDTTVVVSNFPFAATLESIKPMVLDKCAGISAEDAQAAGAILSTVTGVELVRTKAGHSRGMVEIEFPPVSVDDVSALAGRRAFLQLVVGALNGYEYNSRCLKAEVKDLTPKAVVEIKVDPLLAQKWAGSLAAPHLTTVFVSHFGPDVTTEQLRGHFASCGEILAAKVSVDKKTGVSKCTGLVQFSSEAGRKEALLLSKSSLAGQEISVTPSRFSLIPVAAAPTASSATAVGQGKMPSEESTGGQTAAARSERAQPASAPPKAPSASLARMSTVSFKPRNVVKQAPKGKVQL